MHIPEPTTNIKARQNTRGTLWSAREIDSVVLSAEQERHTRCVSRCLKKKKKKNITIGDRVNTRERGSLAAVFSDRRTNSGKPELQNRKIILCNASTP